MTGTEHTLPTFYRPAEVATMLGCSEWWVKEQARRRRVPYCWIGGSYRFTADHIREIAQLCEIRPVNGGQPAERITGVRRSTRVESGPVTLVARLPRRLRQVHNEEQSAA